MSQRVSKQAPRIIYAQASQNAKPHGIDGSVVNEIKKSSLKKKKERKIVGLLSCLFIRDLFNVVFFCCQRKLGLLRIGIAVSIA